MPPFVNHTLTTPRYYYEEEQDILFDFPVPFIEDDQLSSISGSVFDINCDEELTQDEINEISEFNDYIDYMEYSFESMPVEENEQSNIPLIPLTTSYEIIENHQELMNDVFQIIDTCAPHNAYITQYELLKLYSILSSRDHPWYRVTNYIDMDEFINPLLTQSEYNSFTCRHRFLTISEAMDQGFKRNILVDIYYLKDEPILLPILLYVIQSYYTYTMYFHPIDHTKVFVYYTPHSSKWCYTFDMQHYTTTNVLSIVHDESPLTAYMLF